MSNKGADMESGIILQVLLGFFEREYPDMLIDVRVPVWRKQVIFREENVGLLPDGLRELLIDGGAPVFVTKYALPVGCEYEAECCLEGARFRVREDEAQRAITHLLAVLWDFYSCS